MRSQLLPLLLARGVYAVLDVDLNSPESIKQAAASVVQNLLTYYHGNESGQIPGILPGPPPGGPYYWWEGGALWGTLIDYWHYTGDATYNDMISQAMLFQSEKSYQPGNWSLSLGNDDQGFWGMSAILAAETVFPNPPSDQPQWLALAQAVFNTQADPERHDSTCGGGLRWQIPPMNRGYNYKNSIANGVFFNVGARLARYTQNQTYADWAVKTWDWLNGVGFMTPQYDVYDGAHVDTNCTDIAKPQFSYNAGVYLQGAAFMYNYTNGSTLWQQRVEGLLDRTINVFLSTGAVVEVSCELPKNIQCDTDQLSFKGYLLRWMASASQVAPFIQPKVMGVLQKNAAMAIKACNGNVCGFRWTTGNYDGITGVGQQMSMVAALTSLLVTQNATKIPVTAATGGTSKGDPNAGTVGGHSITFAPITTADRAGAGILTLLTLSGLIAVVSWINSGMSEGAGPWYRPFQ